MPLPIWDGAHRRAAADAGDPAHQSPAEGSIPPVLPAPDG